MKSLRLALFGLVALALAACDTPADMRDPASASVVIASPIAAQNPVVQTAGTVTVIADKITLGGSRTLLLANNAYQGAAAAVTPVVLSRRLSPATVDRIDVLNKQAYRLLTAADTGLTIAQRAAGVFAIADDLYRLIGR